MFAICERDRLGTAMYAELGQDAVDVRRDRLRADYEPRHDRALIESLCEELQHFELSGRQATVAVSSRPAQ